MALSLSTSTLLRFSDVRPYRSNSPHQPKQPIKLIGTPLSFSSDWSFIRSRNLLKHRESCLKLTSDDSYNLQKATPLRASAQLGTESLSPANKLGNFLRDIWLFLRPLCAIAVSIQFFFTLARIWMENWHVAKFSPWWMLIKTFAAFVSLQFAQGLVNGINAVYDIEIDKISKPHLPLATGEFSVEYAWLLLVFFLGTGIPLALLIRSGPFLIAMGIMTFLGFAYSCPPFRWKCSTFGAIVTSGLTQGTLMLFSTHGSAKHILGLPFQLSYPSIYMLIFGSVFSFGMGFLKDISDYEGDVANGVPTLAAKVGLKDVTFLGAGLVIVNYIGGILAAIYMPQAFRRSIVIPSHIVLALSLIFQVWKMEKTNYPKEERLNFHKLLWALFHIEYLIYLLM